MNKYFVTYEQSVKLKEFGFDWKCGNSYIEKVVGSEREEYDDDEYQYVTVYDIKRYPKPRLDQAAEWLREVKDIHVVPVLENVNNVYYCCHVTQLHKSFKRIIDNDKYFRSYETALSAGIDAALGMLTNKEK